LAKLTLLKTAARHISAFDFIHDKKDTIKLCKDE